MKRVLIACDNDPQTGLHDFFDSCSCEAKQICTDNNIGYTSVYPPNLNKHSVIGVMPEHNLCFFAGHGDADGVYNEVGDAVVSKKTTNYNFNGKGFYGIACSCAKNLHPHLKARELKFFVGYIAPYVVRGEREPFVISAMAGLKSFLNGDTLGIAKEKMIAAYNNQIALLDKTDKMAAVDLLHNRESLVFEGDDNLLFSDLQ
jgi:hypothetical protein